MSSSGKAGTTDQGGYVDLTTYDWASTGNAPSNPSESVYSPYDEPAAELDNNYNYSIREDLKRLNYGLGQVQADVTSLQGDAGTLRTDVDELRTDFDTHHHDSRYYRKYEADSRFVTAEGDRMTGDLQIEPLGGGSGDYDAGVRIEPKDTGEGRISYYRDGTPHWEIGSGDLYDVDGDNRWVVWDVQRNTTAIAVTHDPQVDINAPLRVGSGDVMVDGIAADLTIGDGPGPHMLTFGNQGGATDAMSLAFRTGRQAAVFEDDRGNSLFEVGLDNTVDASGSDYVQLPVRSSTLSTAPAGATYIID